MKFELHLLDSHMSLKSHFIVYFNLFFCSRILIPTILHFAVDRLNRKLCKNRRIAILRILLVCACQ